jgi:predicted helicase
LQFEKNLQNDYVKFLRLAELLVSSSRSGLVGFITSHAFLTNRTLRGMRESLLDSYADLRFLNLHGNIASGEAAALTSKDENVFEISEGVAISLMLRDPFSQEHSVRYADLAGLREEKYRWLGGNTGDSTTWEGLHPVPPNFIFAPVGDAQAAFDEGLPLEAVVKQRSAGVITARDDFATDKDEAALVARVESFAESPLRGEALRQSFAIRDKKGWDVDMAQAQARDAMPLRAAVYPYCYRPFDSRFIAYNKGIVWGMAYPTLKHTMGGRNLVLIAMQQFQYDVPEYCYVFVTRSLVDSRVFVSKTGVATVFPLYLQAASDNQLETREDINLSPEFISLVREGTGLDWLPHGAGNLEDGGSVGPEDLFTYMYAQLHSPLYRMQFAQPLRASFPRVFVPSGLEVFRALTKYGRELVALHLMESPKLAESVATYIGPASPKVVRVGWADNAIWLDAASAGKDGATAPGTVGFRGAAESVWKFYIGGYQVCEKWLKDRKGTTLRAKDLAHYVKILGAIEETIRVQGEIDRVIATHGGWDRAFVASRR